MFRYGRVCAAGAGEAEGLTHDEQICYGVCGDLCVGVGAGRLHHEGG